MQYMPYGESCTLRQTANNIYLIDYLSNSVEELKLGYDFNLKLSNLPSSIKKITFAIESMYNKELNCLPNGLEYLKLPFRYKQEIKNVPKGLKKILCSEI